MDNDSSDQGLRRGVQSVDVVGRLLNAFCEYKYPLRLKELAAASDMSPAKAHRYVTSLVRIGLAAQGERTGLYSVGPMALRLGLVAIERDDIIDKAGNLLRKLCAEFQTSGHLGIWGERGPVLIKNEHGGPPVMSSMGIGAVMPLLRSSTGRVFLSYMPRESTRLIVYSELAATNMAPNEVDRIVSETRKNGFSLIAGEFILGLNAIACPIFSIDGTIACSVSLVTTNPELFVMDSPSTKSITSAVEKMNRDWGCPSKSETRAE